MPPLTNPAAIPLTSTDTQPPLWRIWWLAIRPRTLSISLAPVLAGSALAHAEGAAWRFDVFVAALLCAILIQVATNLHNDAVDFLKGNDLPDRRGPPRVTAAGWISHQAVRRAALACFALAVLPGAYLVWSGGWLILAIGLASLLAGWAYSGGPRPISYTPLGELFVLIFFGLVAVGGSYWLQGGQRHEAFWLVGLVVGLPAAAVLLVNNHRDLAADQQAGRLTLAMLLGPQASGHVYGSLLALPFLLLGLLATLGHLGAWLGWLALPLAGQRLADFRRALSGEALNKLLAQTAQSGFLLSLLLSIGLFLETC